MPELHSPPRRRLPLEVILLVLEQADPSTLAVLGRVSYDFLSSASPLLYRSVSVDSAKALSGLFCKWKEVKTSSPSRINPLLTLSQIRTLNLDFSSSRLSLPTPLPHLSFSRLDRPGPIPLDNLQIITPYPEDGLYALIQSNLFPRFNPIRFQLAMVEDEGEAASLWVDLGDGPLLDGWTRLQEVQVKGGLPFLSSPDEEGLFLAGLPRPTLARRRVLRIFVALSSRLTSLSTRFGKGHRWFALGRMQDASIIVMVKSEEEKLEMEEAIRTNEDVERWRRVFAVEVGTC